MEKNLRIENIGNIALVYSPYNNDFSNQIKYINNASWDKEKECWKVPKSAVPAIREIMKGIYGTDDITNAETVNIKLTITRDLTNLRKDINFCGKCLCHAYGRDSKVTVGTDVVYVKGHPCSGGSAKNWECIVPEGAVIYVSNVSTMLLKDFMNNDVAEDMEIEVLPFEEECNREALQKERQTLAHRIEEIDKLLQNDAL